ncbi:hypothetical protein PVT67_01310 [Gallaecimonas kandeliae]|uniref:hypothetical protein n=1 Tax=Gallaecimonas kandeliae TaxID=3029055 RepID=UPI0026473E3A|nr:hypothetical protein [Gallaecimonas kandeliae]WKE65928.1 hypothetical protein PVT67_01310 [Gallaecimonas kandeliae]
MIRILMVLLVVAVLALVVRTVLLNPDQAQSQATLANQQGPAGTLTKTKKNLDANMLRTYCLNAIQARYGTTEGFRVKELGPGRYQLTLGQQQEELHCSLDEKGQVELK